MKTKRQQQHMHKVMYASLAQTIFFVHFEGRFVRPNISGKASASRCLEAGMCSTVSPQLSQSSIWGLG
jgi:hypothetical protein